MNAKAKRLKRPDLGVTSLTFPEMLGLNPASAEELKMYGGHKPKVSILKCECCGSKDINVLGDMCNRCGASLSDPHNNYREE